MIIPIEFFTAKEQGLITKSHEFVRQHWNLVDDMATKSLEIIILINEMDGEKLQAYRYSNHTKLIMYIHHVIEVKD